MKNIDEKIKKIVALIDGAATEGEARAASLALQRLLVANNLKLEDINLDDSPAEVGEEACDLGRRIPSEENPCTCCCSELQVQHASSRQTMEGLSFSLARARIQLSPRAVLGRAPMRPRTASGPLRANEEHGYGNVSRQKGVKGTWMLRLHLRPQASLCGAGRDDESMALAIVVPESVNRRMDGIGLRTTKIKVGTTWRSLCKADGYESGYGFGGGNRVTAASA